MTHPLRNYFHQADTPQDPSWYFPEDGETVDLQHRLDTLERDMRQLESLQVNLESLRDVAATMEEPTEREIALLRLSLESLLSDSGVDTNTLLPSLESDSGQGSVQPSLEAMDNVLKRMLETILKWMKTVWEYMKNFFTKALDATHRLSRQNDNMRDRMKVASGGTLQQKKFEMATEIVHLTIDGKQPANGDDIIEGLKRMRVQADVIYKDYTSSLSKAGQEIADAITAYDNTKPEESLQRVYDAAKEINLERMIQLTNGKDISDSRWESGSIKALDPLPGGQSIFFFFPQVAGQDALLAKSELRRRKAILLDTSQAKEKKVRPSGVVETLTPGQGYEIYRLNKELLEMIKDYAGQRKFIDKAHESVQSAIKKMESIQKKDGDDSQSNRVYFEEVVRYGQAFSYWVKNPHVALTSQIQKTIRAAIVAANHSTDNYRRM